MKKCIALFLILASIFLLGCAAEKPKTDPDEAVTGTQEAVGKETGETSSEASLIEGWKLEDSIDAAPVIFEGVCLSKSAYEPLGAADMSFRAERVYRGGVEAGDEHNVMANDFGAFEVGKSYILLSIPRASVFSGKELYYQADLTIALNDDICVCELEDVNGAGRGETEERILAYIAGHPYTGDTAVIFPFCTSDDLMEIAEYSDQVALVTADEILVNEGDRTVYACTVETCLKGSASGKIRVIAFKNGMEPGGQYLVLLSNAASDQPLYIMSSQRSLLRADSAEAEELIDKLD